MNIKVKVLKDFYIQDIDGNDVCFTEGEVHDFMTSGPTGWPMIKNNKDNEYYDVTFYKKDENSKEWYSDFEQDELYLIEV